MLPVNKVLEDLKMPKQRIDEVVLVGGSTRIPKIQQMLKAVRQSSNVVLPDVTLSVSFPCSVFMAESRAKASTQTKPWLMVPPSKQLS